MNAFFHRDRGPLAALLLICAVLYLPALGGAGFWEPDEPEFALLARTMAERGDWVVPFQNGHWYAEKPPLLYWAVLATTGGGAAFEGDGARAPFLARLPSVLAAVAAVIALYLFARAPLGRRAAFLSAAILATGGLFAAKARYLQTDMLLASAVTISILCFLVADRSPHRRPGVPALLGGWFALALAVLAKGPLGAVLVLLALAGHLALRPRGSLRRAVATPVHLAGLALFAAVVLPWYLLVPERLGAEEGAAFLRENLLHQNLGRTVGSWSHGQPFWYYLRTLPIDLLPWSPVVAAGLLWGWRRARRDGEPFARTALAWFLPGFLLLSAISSKQGKYLLPLYPPLALLAGSWLDGPASRNPLGRAARWTVGGTAALLAAAGLAASLAPLLPVPAAAAHPEIARALVPGGIVLLLGAAVAAVRLLLLADPVRAAADTAAATALGGALLFALGLPALDPVKSARGFAGEVRAVSGDAAVAQFGTWRSAYPYYLRRDTPDLTFGEGDERGRLPRGEVRRVTAERTRAFVALPGRGFVITRRGIWRRRMPDDLRALFEEAPLVERAVGGKTMVLLAERER